MAGAARGDRRLTAGPPGAGGGPRRVVVRELRVRVLAFECRTSSAIRWTSAIRLLYEIRRLDAPSIHVNPRGRFGFTGGRATIGFSPDLPH